MKFLRRFLAFVCASAAIAHGEQNPSKAVSQADAMRALRLQWLSEKPKLEADDRGGRKIYAALMDWPIGRDHTATVLSSSFGDASLYTTSTFGVLGGIGHDSVRKAAAAFISAAEAHIDLTSGTTDFSYASKGEARFFFVTSKGVRSITFPFSEVERVGSPASELFARAQDVVTQLRLITEKQKVQGEKG